VSKAGVRPPAVANAVRYAGLAISTEGHVRIPTTEPYRPYAFTMTPPARHTVPGPAGDDQAPVVAYDRKIRDVPSSSPGPHQSRDLFLAPRSLPRASENGEARPNARDPVLCRISPIRPTSLRLATHITLRDNFTVH
jgi:hypothetical protein